MKTIEQKKTARPSATTIAAFALVSALALSLTMRGTAAAAMFAGEWAISATLGNPVVETTAPTCVFAQSGSKISGSCKGPSAAGPAIGTVSGNSVIWEWHKIPTNRLQVNSIATYRGSFSAKIIRGTWTDTYDRGLVGPFTGQRLK